MELIRSTVFDTTRSPMAAASMERAARTAGPKAAEQEEKQHPDSVTDTYIHEKKEKPAGLYRPGKKADGPDKDAPSRKSESCRGDTDKVDREIEQLKKKKKELEQKLHSETDEMKTKDLKKELAQVERELKQKDNDAYRRQHSTFT